MIKDFFLVISFFSCLISFAQKTPDTKKPTTTYNTNATYSVEQVLQDIDYTEKYLIKFHPDPFRYITKDSLHAFVLRVKSSIDKPQTQMQIRFYLKQIVAKIGCGHSDVASSKEYEKAIQALNRPVLPFNLFVVDTNKLCVLNNLSKEKKDSIILAGDEILSIDEHPVNSILKRMYSIYTTDGYNQTYQKQGMRYDWFKYYYSFCYGFKNSYTATIKHSNGQVASYTFSAISSKDDTLILPKKDTVIAIQKTKMLTYYRYSKDSTVAVIDINSFGGSHWRRFMRRSFKDIKKRKITNLVIDVRDNGGGQIDKGMNFLSYLIHKPISLPFDRKPNLMLLNPKWKAGLGTRITPILFCATPIFGIHKGRWRHYFIALPKLRNAYKGNVYVLINGKSFSMSAVASSYLKYKAKAIVIGEETGGNVRGSNAVISGKIVLPNTHIRVLIPMYHIYHQVKTENDGHGIMPDYPTHYDAKSILKAEDLDLLKVLEIKNTINK